MLYSSFNMASSSDFLKRFNAAALPRTKRLTDLVVGQEYQIVSMRKAITRYGPALISLLQDDEGPFEMYLPSRYEVIFRQEDLKDFDFTNLRLVYDESLKIVSK